ncbi:draxin-like [Ochotona curzoniae]|uniref:draxin-like n=2 Tax=Ochotona curzoniae TaxID=130825 RepID=UPI001B34EA0E|nr:draxin-like [Ochotona curzoniae]
MSLCSSFLARPLQMRQPLLAPLQSHAPWSALRQLSTHREDPTQPGHSLPPPAHLSAVPAPRFGPWQRLPRAPRPSPPPRRPDRKNPTMPASPMMFLSLLTVLQLSLASSLAPGTLTRYLPENHIELPGPALWEPQARHLRRRGPGKKERGPGMPGQAQDGAVVTANRQNSGLPGAGKPLPEQSPAGLTQDKHLLLDLALPNAKKEDRSPGWERVKKRGREQKRRRDRLRQHRGRALVRGPSSLMKKAEPFDDQTLDATMEDSSTSLAPTMLFLATLEAASATEESLILPAPSLLPQQAQPRQDGEVTPTLDMALFDWTDYEDLKPEVWPSAEKKEKHWRPLPSSDGNQTSPAEEESCSHHQDCLPGSCCDLRERVCTPHNRGLNNKCFDDCMCVEGLRCYAKFHRNRRVTRRKGRCVEPETANSDQGSFINV